MPVLELKRKISANQIYQEAPVTDEFPIQVLCELIEDDTDLWDDHRVMVRRHIITAFNDLSSLWLDNMPFAVIRGKEIIITDIKMFENAIGSKNLLTSEITVLDPNFETDQYLFAGNGKVITEGWETGPPDYAVPSGKILENYKIQVWEHDEGLWIETDGRPWAIAQTLNEAKTEIIKYYKTLTKGLATATMRARLKNFTYFLLHYKNGTVEMYPTIAFKKGPVYSWPAQRD